MVSVTPRTTSTSGSRSRRFGGKQSERGATMVEFAIISVALFSMIFLIIEGGFAVRSRNSMNNAVDDAARRGAVAGTSPNADWLILQQLKGRLGGDTIDNIEFVVVYKGDSAGEIPAGCIDGNSVPMVCNVYRDGQIDASEGAFGCPGGLGTQWCPSDRTSDDDGLAFLGVYVKAKHEPIINQIFFDASFNTSANSLQALETSGEL